MTLGDVTIANANASFVSGRRAYTSSSGVGQFVSYYVHQGSMNISGDGAFVT